MVLGTETCTKWTRKLFAGLRRGEFPVSKLRMVASATFYSYLTVLTFAEIGQRRHQRLNIQNRFLLPVLQLG